MIKQTNIQQLKASFQRLSLQDRAKLLSELQKEMWQKQFQTVVQRHEDRSQKEPKTSHGEHKHLDLTQYISVDPEVCHGKPCFKDTRIMIYLALELLEDGVSIEDILSEGYYPQLTPQHIQAALHYVTELVKGDAVFPLK